MDVYLKEGFWGKKGRWVSTQMTCFRQKRGDGRDSTAEKRGQIG